MKNKTQKTRRVKPIQLIMEKDKDRGVIARPMAEETEGDVDDILEEVRNKGVTLEKYQRVHLKPEAIDEGDDTVECENNEEDCENDEEDDDE